MARFSKDLHDIEAANALKALSQVPQTQLSTDQLMRELSSS